MPTYLLLPIMATTPIFSFTIIKILKQNQHFRVILYHMSANVTKQEQVNLIEIKADDEEEIPPHIRHSDPSACPHSRFHADSSSRPGVDPKGFEPISVP